MININLYHRLSNPARSNFKMIDPVIGSALIGAGADIIGGLFGMSSADKAAEAQLQATRETNEMNYKIFKEQNQWNLDQWNRQNAYNDPAAQMLRFRNAGVNPFFALNNIAGTSAAGSLTSAPAPTMQTPDVATPMMQGGMALANGISGAGSAVAQGVVNQSNIDNQTAQTQATVQNLVAQANLAEAISKLNGSKEKMQSIQNEILDASKHSLISYNDNMARNMAAQTAWTQVKVAAENLAMDETISRTRLNDINRQIAEYHLNNVLPLQMEKTRKEIGVIVNQAVAVLAQARLFGAQAKQALAQSGLFKEMAKQIGLNNKQMEDFVNMGYNLVMAQYNNIIANTGLAHSSTKGTDLSNEFSERTMDSRVKGTNYLNNDNRLILNDAFASMNQIVGAAAQLGGLLKTGSGGAMFQPHSMIVNYGSH